MHVANHIPPPRFVYPQPVSHADKTTRLVFEKIKVRKYPAQLQYHSQHPEHLHSLPTYSWRLRV